MINKKTTPLLNWIISVVLILIPFGIGLFILLKCLTGTDPKLLLQAKQVIIEVVFPFILPIMLMAIFLYLINILPKLRSLNKLSPKLAIALVVLVSFLSVSLAGLNPINAYMTTVVLCFTMNAGLATFSPGYWLYFVSLLSITLSFIVSIRIFFDVRAT